MTYFLIAGEASGDMHAAHLMEALQNIQPHTRFVGLGGDKMRQAGCEILVDYRHMAFMGVMAVVKNIRTIQQNFQIAHQALLREKPEVLILIDYPSFNLKIARFCRQHLPHTKIVYYIPPKVWAWKAWRIHSIARYSDQILGIFPFEADYYAQHGYTCHYVGNPTADMIRALPTSFPSHQEQPTIALLPGSRRSEIAHCLPTMLAAAKQVAGNHYQIEVAAAPGIEDDFYTPLLQGTPLTRDTHSLLQRAHAAVVNSGTATLETALIGCPQTAVYYIACSKWLQWLLEPIFFHMPWFTLVNILLQQTAIQELIARRFTQQNIQQELTRLVSDESYRAQIQASYRKLHQLLGNQPAALNAAKIISTL